MKQSLSFKAFTEAPSEEAAKALIQKLLELGLKFEGATAYLTTTRNGISHLKILDAKKEGV